MRVDNFDLNRNRINQAQTAQGKDAVQVKKSFKDEITDRSSEMKRETLLNLTHEIIEQGNLIVKKCDIKEFARYKELITAFFNEVVDEGFSFSRETKQSRDGRRKVYSNIKKTDEKLDLIAKELLREQKDQIFILKTVEDIRGIILDTFM